MQDSIEESFNKLQGVKVKNSHRLLGTNVMNNEQQ